MLTLVAYALTTIINKSPINLAAMAGRCRLAHRSSNRALALQSRKRGGAHLVEQAEECRDD